MELVEAVGVGPVGLDTAIFIYFIEEHPRYLSALQAIFARLDAGELRAVTSAVTLGEVLVVPYRVRDFALAERYESLLTRSRGLVFRDLDRQLLRAAAQLRASTGMRMPDALQVAAALGGQCSTFLTNDRRVPSIPGLDILQLDDLVA